jgi:hypothetical protein
VIEHVGANEAARTVSARVQGLGQRRELVADIEAAVVAHAVKGGEGAVSSEVCAGNVSGATVAACSKRSPRAARASITGVAAALYP